MCFKLFTPDVRTKRFNYKSYTLHTVYKYNRYKITIHKNYTITKGNLRASGKMVYIV